MTTKSFLFGMSLFLALSHYTACLTDTWYVNAGATGPRDGRSPETGFQRIQQGIDAASNGDTVIVGEGVYREAVNFLGKAIVLESRNPEDRAVVAATVLDGSGLGRPVVTFNSRENNDSVIAGFTITGGDARDGGGISCFNASPTVRNNLVRGNKAEFGGGIFLEWGMSAQVIQNEVKENIAREGGGVYCGGESPVVQGNTICSNHATEDGGGICVGCRSGVITGNLIQGNSTERNGGGVAIESCVPGFTNNVVVGNRAVLAGGGVFVIYAHAILINNTVVGNRAGVVGGVCPYEYGSAASLTNCILWDNEDDSWLCELSYCCVQNIKGARQWPEYVGQGNFSLSPHFVDPQSGDYHLASWSRCVDAGDPQSDFSNEPEPNGGRIDIGAYGNTPEATSKSLDTDSDKLPDDWELHYFGDLSQTSFGDPDGDGIFNADEYLWGWNPVVAEEVGVRNSGSGRSYLHIQDAIDQAQGGDELVAYPARYREQIDFLGKNIALRSADPEDRETVASTVIDGGRTGAVVSFVKGEGREAVISGFTITGGGDQGPGGIYCEGSSPTITRNLITGNEPCEYSGGGIACSGGSPLIAFNTITKNRSCGGGAGIHCSGGSPDIVNNLVENNDGGGISCWGGSPVIEGNVIRLNRTWGSGGGVCCSECPALIQNNVIADNWAGDNGGGIGCGGKASLTIINNTITGNVAVEGGAGIYAEGNGSPVIENCIIWNRGTELIGCSASYSCIRGGGPGEGNISQFPHFVDSANGNYHLATWSPCIDAGNPASPFDNEPQPNGGRIDIGAYGNTPEATSKSRDKDSDGLPDTWEVAYFGGLHEIPEGDADGDFIRNGSEYGFGWDPMKPAASRVVNRATDEWYEEIQMALYEAEEGAEIVVLPGTYHENLVFPALSISLSSLAPSDPAVIASTIIDGDGSGSVIIAIGGSEATTRICGLTITGGNAYRGGGVHCEGVMAVIENNVITKNSAQAAGAGIYCLDCSPRITGNTIRDNQCDGRSASGIYCQDCSSFIADNIISGNSCMYWGAGIACFSGSAVIRDNWVTENRCGQEGGGMYCGFCTVAIQGNQMYGNDSGCDGGGLHLEQATAVVTGNLICGNSAGCDGGGIFSLDSSTALINNTIADNWANYTGGVHSRNSSVSLTNCILWANGDDLYGCSATYSCIEDTGRENEGEGNIHADPLFVDPTHGDYHVLANSPCVDAGTNASPDIPSVDMDGEYRPFGLRVDMGADEFVDQDQDLLPDYWEIRSFANLWCEAEDDPDGDGLLNSQELAHSTNPRSSDTDSDGKSDSDEVFAGTDPLDTNSSFQIRRVEHTLEGVIVEWLTVPGREYQVYMSPDLTRWSPLGETVRAEASDTSLSVVHAEASALDKSFYRVEVLP